MVQSGITCRSGHSSTSAYASLTHYLDIFGHKVLLQLAYQPISFRPTHSIIHVQHHAVVIVQDCTGVCLRWVKTLLLFLKLCFECSSRAEKHYKRTSSFTLSVGKYIQYVNRHSCGINSTLLALQECFLHCLPADQGSKEDLFVFY